MPTSYRAYVKLMTEDFDRLFIPSFKTKREALSYAEHKLDFWPTAERFGSYSAAEGATAEWKNGRLRPLFSTTHDVVES